MVDGIPGPGDPVLMRDELIEILAEDLSSRGAAEDAARQVLEDRGDVLYADLVWNLTNLRYSPEEARELWKGILEHKYFVSERLQRNVGIRVAALDYFANILGRLVHPRIVDPVELERLYADAIVDPLTGLSNRRHYRQRFLAELARASRHGSSFVLGIFDVDNFKKLNDTEGHAAGDRILKAIAEILRSTIRESDLVARWGGEEFIMLLPETPKRDAASLAERQRRRIAESLAGHSVTVSCGLAAYGTDGDTEEGLFSFADRALYRAKSNGKNQVCLAPYERRAYPRLDESLEVHLIPVPNDALASTSGETRNVGGGGVCILYAERVDVSALMTGRITVDARTISFEGRVVRVEEVARDRYDVAIEFLSIHPDDRELLMAASHM